MENYTIIKPLKIADIWKDKQQLKKRMYFLAGCTDVMVYLREGLLQEGALLADISGLQEMNFIKESGSFIEIGGLTPFCDIIGSAIVKKYAPVLAEASKTIGSPQLRSRATIGGNLGNASPAGDSLPALAVLDAEVVTRLGGSVKKYQVSKLFAGPKKTVLKNGELITAVKFKKPGAAKGVFVKLGSRNSMAISKLSVAVLYSAEKNKVKNIRIACGAVAPTVVRATKTEKFLTEKKLDQFVISEAKEMLRKEISPISDIRSTGGYRRAAAANLLENILLSAVK